jgi:signal transduction histidine kinase
MRRLKHNDDKPKVPPTPRVRLTRKLAGDPPEPTDSPFAVERLTALSHDLGGLIDGSLRWLGIARRSLQSAELDEAQLEAVSHQLETVQGALDRMVDLINAAMKGSSSVVGSPTLSTSNGITLKEAIEHAAQVVLPQADERGIAIDVAISSELQSTPAGPLYSVVLNGLRNAVESIVSAQDVLRVQSGGLIEIHAALTHPKDGRGKTHTLVFIEIRDDGAGITNGEAAGKAFEFGYTTKPGGTGLGLALCREVVRDLGGVIELARRDDRPASGRAGAVLRVSYPPISAGKGER